MSESQELYASVNYIKHKVDAIEKIEFLNLRSNKALQEEYVALLQADGLLLRVYDGSKSQKEIATELGTNEMAISRKIKILEEHGLIEIKEVGKNGKKIHKYSVAEKAFKLSKI